MKRIQTSKADETPEFVEFWEGPMKEDGTRDRRLGWISIMHKNDGRGQARDTFFQHIRQLGADGQDIADGSKWYINNRDDWKLHASTWINRRAYEDGAEMYRSYKASEAERQASRAQNVTGIRQGDTAFLREFRKKAGG